MSNRHAYDLLGMSDFSAPTSPGVRAERSEALNTSITVPKLLPPSLFDPMVCLLVKP